jgi:hypothetical protein
MNKFEKITKIQNEINKFYKENDLSEEVRVFLNKIFDEVEDLRKDDSLKEKLEWEEDIEYEALNTKWKLRNNHLFYYNKYEEQWELFRIAPSGYKDLIADLRDAERI